MAHPVAPQTDIVLEPTADLGADGAAGVGGVVALPPLVVEAGGVVLGDQVLAVRLAEFGVPADFVDDDAALLALEDVRKPPVGQFPAQVAEVERFLLRTLPFMPRGFEFVPHDFVLQARLRERFGLEHQQAGDEGDQHCDDDGDREEHLLTIKSSG